jgi:hypothetical protein
MATDAQGRITYAVSDDWVTSTDHPATFMAQVVNFTSGGEERWRAAVPVSVRDAAAMPTGEVFVAGVHPPADGSVTGLGATETAVTKLDADGNPVWSRSLGVNPGPRGGVNVPQIAVEPSGSLWVLDAEQRYGSPPNPTSFVRPSLARLSPGGDALWQKTVGGEFDYVYPVDMTLEPNGQAVMAVHLNQGALQIAGTEYGQSASDSELLIGVDPDGNLSWARGIAESLDDNIYSIASSSDGTLYVSGSTMRSVLGEGTTTRAFVVAVSPGGDVLWRKSYSEGPEPQMDNGSIVATRPCGGLFLASYYRSNGTTGIFLLDLDDSGQELRQRRFLDTPTGYNTGYTGDYSALPVALAAHGTDGLALLSQFRGQVSLGSLSVSSPLPLPIDTFIARLAE